MHFYGFSEGYGSIHSGNEGYLSYRYLCDSQSGQNTFLSFEKMMHKAYD